MNCEETKLFAEQRLGSPAYPTCEIHMLAGLHFGRLRQRWVGPKGMAWFDLPIEEVDELPPREELPPNVEYFPVGTQVEWLTGSYVGQPGLVVGVYAKVFPARHMVAFYNAKGNPSADFAAEAIFTDLKKIGVDLESAE